MANPSKVLGELLASGQPTPEIVEGEILAGDFVDAKENNLIASKRKNIVKDYTDYWGVKWFMLQNVAYGDWEGALYNFDYSLSPEEVHKTRIKSLDPQGN